ncbi:MAG: glycoside hydrolase family 88 protein [Steroidobacteraceae bacterium]
MTFRVLATTLLLVASAVSQAAAAEPAHEPIDAAVRLADWQLARMGQPASVSRKTDETGKPRAWEQAVFWVGMTALADAGGPPRIKQAIVAMGNANRWLPGDKPYFADDHAITQSYLWAASNGAGEAARAPTRRALDNVIGKPAVTTLAFYVPPEGYGATECLTRWCWCDALFMAPAAFMELSRQTGDDRYRNFAVKEFWATTDFLFDPVEHLYYRDSRFFERRDAKGRKMFWSRGNGWVFAGIPRIVAGMPKDSGERRRMEALFVEMATRLRELQKPDGYWPPSLLAPEDSPPETSGTAFYTYGMAWGISAGLLPRDQYEPVVRRGWAALTKAIQPDGRLGWVQQVSDRPETVAPGDTQYYGVGAFLLAATAVAELDKSKR